MLPVPPGELIFSFNPSPREHVCFCSIEEKGFPLSVIAYRLSNKDRWFVASEWQIPWEKLARLLALEQEQ